MKIDQRRVQQLQTGEPGQGLVLYVMAREQRVTDNAALVYAMEQANERAVPLLVLFALGPMFQHGFARHNEWMVASLRAVSENLSKKTFLSFLRWESGVHPSRTSCKRTRWVR